MRPDSESYRRGVWRALLVTLALNVVVVAGKLAAGLIAGGLSFVIDAIHPSVASLNNIAGLAVIRTEAAFVIFLLGRAENSNSSNNYENRQTTCRRRSIPIADRRLAAVE